MNKTELVSAVAASAGLSKKDAEKAVNGVIDTIISTVKSGEKVQLVGFGTFELRERAAREGINPASGEKIKIAACKAPAFKAGKAFKDAVN
ncbi:MAG TPA: HU family DNA-binding protein [Clostridiales bacterium]|jgi:DNA-binding protein HU-beta|nr:HU family DNA-binding protein [Clostridiales bacterium]